MQKSPQWVQAIALFLMGAFGYTSVSIFLRMLASVVFQVHIRFYNKRFLGQVLVLVIFLREHRTSKTKI